MAIGSFHFDPFEVLQDEKGEPWVLGTGSFGTTYKVRHKTLGRICALKVIREDLVYGAGVEGEEKTARFFGEVKALANMHHHGIAIVFEYHDRKDEGFFYYAMEFCKGGNLHELIQREGPLSWPLVRWLALQIAEALKYAHGCGLLHRDIKPANIMLAEPWPEQKTKLIDFGIVQALEPGEMEDSHSASSRQGVFNDATASPEQMLSEPLDARSDLFSLGVTLWWLLVGRNPFEGQPRAQLISSRISPVSYAKDLPADLDPEAREILLRLMEKRPADRFGNVQELIDRLTSGLLQTPPAEAPAAAAKPAPAARPILGSPVEYDVAYSIPNPRTDLISKTPQAAVYRVKNLATGETVAAIAAEAGMSDEARAGFRAAASARTDFGAYRLLDWCSSANEEYFIASLPDGQNLLEILRRFGSSRAQDALPLLACLARSFDASVEWTTCGIQLELGDLRVRNRQGESTLETFRSWSDLDPASARSLPLFQSDGDQDVGSTRTTSDTGAVRPVSRFAALVYRIIAGSSPHYASYFTTAGYVMVSGLSEEGNHLLARALAGEEGETGMEDLLLRLARVEALPCGDLRASGSSGSSRTSSSRSSIAVPVAPPADLPPPPPVHRTASPPPPVPVAPPQPLTSAVPAPPVPAGQDKKSRPRWLAPAAALLIAVPIIFLVVQSRGESRKKETAEQAAEDQQEAAEKEAQKAAATAERERQAEKDKEELRIAREEAQKAKEEVERERAEKKRLEKDATVTALGKILDSTSASPAEKKKAFEELQPFVEEKHKEAILLNGISYMYGYGVKDDPSKAYQYLEQAAKAGGTRAMFALGRYFKEGKGAAKPDMAKMQYWWKLGAGKGEPKSAFELGLAHYFGLGSLLPKDPRTGVFWFRRAAELENSDGMVLLGRAYDSGEGVDVADPKASFEWYDQAAKRDNYTGVAEAGRCYLLGKGVQQNELAAVELLKKAYSRNETTGAAKYWLGYCYLDGLGGLEEDREEAARLINEAIRNRHPDPLGLLKQLEH